MAVDIYSLVSEAVQNKKPQNSPNGSTSSQAKRLGLTYLGFGRYGVMSKDKKKFETTHIVDNQRLKPVSPMHFSGKEKPKPIIPNVDPDWKKTFSDRYKSHIEKSTDIKYGYNDKQHVSNQIEDTKKHKNWAKKITADHTEQYHKEGIANGGIMKAIDVYTEDGYEEINKVLYTDKKLTFSHADRTTQFMIDQLDKFFDDEGSQAIHDYKVYTGTTTTMDPGKDFIFKGFLSTSADPNVANKFSGKKLGKKATHPSVIEINVKKGQKILDINAIHAAYKKREKNTQYDPNYGGNRYPREMEHVLPRNTKLKIIGQPKLIINPETGDVVQHYTAEIVEDK